MAVKKSKPKPIQFQIGWPGLIAIVISSVCVLLWTFVLGFWMGQKVFTGNGTSKVKTTVISPKTSGTESVVQQAEKPEDLLYGNETGLFEQNEAIQDIKEKLKQEESPGHTQTIPTETITEPAMALKREKGGTALEEKKGKTIKKENKGEKISKKPKAGLKVEKISSQKREGLKHFFSLQIASYKDSSKARKERARWEKKGYYVQVKRADLGRRGIWYRVLLGRYKDLGEAKKAASRLASKEGIRSYVVKGDR